MQPVPVSRGAADHLYKTDAIVLKQLPTGEADRLLTVLTPYLGKLKLIGRSVRRPKSKVSGHVEPLMHSRLMVAKSKGIDIISQAETIDAFPHLRGDLERTVWGIYCAELVDAFLPDEAANAPVFTLLADTLSRLDSGEKDVCLRWFELRLLDLTGFRPELRQCAQCGGAVAADGFGFSPEAGGLLCKDCITANRIAKDNSPVLVPSVNAVKALRFLQQENYEEAKRLRTTPALAQELEGMLRFYLRYLLEREVRSTAFLDHIRRQER